jgi:murein DD-endopeptidase MepM/ murein hydrolase activator NlpD
MLNLPDNDIRCGRPDEFIIGGKWPKKNLTWRFIPGNNDPVSKTATRSIVLSSLNQWKKNCQLTFQEVSGGDEGEVDLLFRFVRDDHGDGHPLTANTKVLAHAWLPIEEHDYEWEGDTHWNAYYAWQKYVDLETVTVHEIGHALGLSHSAINQSVMAPVYQGIRHELYPDDIDGIQTLYGPPFKAPQPPLPVLEWPLPGYKVITSTFYDSRSWGLHAAIDISTLGETGKNVVASTDALVTRVFWDNQGGNVIEITNPDGWMLRYLHMKSISAQPGQVVSRGQSIGLSGNTGGATSGPHLHFAVWHTDYNQAVRVQPDPYEYWPGHWAVDPARLLKEDEMSGFTEDDRRVLWQINQRSQDAAPIIQKIKTQLLPGMAPGPFVRIHNPKGPLHGQVHLLLFAHGQGTEDTRRVIGDPREWDVYGGVDATNISFSEWTSIKSAFKEGPPLPAIANA